MLSSRSSNCEELRGSSLEKEIAASRREASALHRFFFSFFPSCISIALLTVQLVPRRKPGSSLNDHI